MTTTPAHPEERFKRGPRFERRTQLYMPTPERNRTMPESQELTQIRLARFRRSNSPEREVSPSLISPREVIPRPVTPSPEVLVDDRRTETQLPLGEEEKEEEESPRTESASPRYPGNTKPVARTGPPKPSDKTFWSGRRFQLTLNEIEEWDKLKAYLQKWPIIYAVACLEEAPTTLHEHIHCYIHYEKSVKIYKKNLFGSHVELCFGTGKENEDYIKKDGHIIWEYGENPTGMRARKTITVKDAINMTHNEIEEAPASSYRWIKLIKEEELIRKWRMEGPKWEPIEVEWLFGPTGTGKTRYSVEQKAIEVHYKDGFFSDWGDARILSLEEMRGEIPYGLLLQLTDSYHGYYIVNIKGSHKIIDIDKVIITSPNPPHKVYTGQVSKTDSIKQLLRRLTKLIDTSTTPWTTLNLDEYIAQVQREMEDKNKDYNAA